VPVGNPGNANDPATGNLYGGVAYTYNIGKYDVTVGQYTAFLNAVAATDTYGLYSPSMASDLNIAGIARNATPSGFTYRVIGSPNHPITYVSWGDAARFANWLDNGQPGLGGPAVPQNAASTEDGAYFLNGATSNAALEQVLRKAGAQWFIPSESEWYKAAYYDPVAGHYWKYATGTNTTPTSAPPGSRPNTANFFDSVKGYAVTGATSNDPAQNYLTDVGAYTASVSPYGTFDQGGDVSQWNETLIGGTRRATRGGSWGFDSSNLSAGFLAASFPASEGNNLGFRVASVPEPSTGVLALLACGLVWWKRKSLRRGV
jgi:formylglycine-generating enzyme